MIKNEMTHPDRKQAKSIDMPGRCRTFTDIVYSGEGEPSKLYAALDKAQHMFDPPAPEYKNFIGEMHGHTNLSDGNPSIDEYFINLRDNVKVDFAAVSDHDHGGVGKPELWVGSPSKWDIIKSKVKQYYQPGKFTTILAYERDSYPFYNNMIIYYSSHEGEMLRGKRDGEITADELRAALEREDMLIVPHDTYHLSAGADLSTIPNNLLTPLIEIYSRGDATEYMGNPANENDSMCRGGFWQDALARGAHMGCIAGSDDHFCKNGFILNDTAYPFNYPGLTGVWAEENTLESIFAALKARRCYGFMGGRITIDFRINGHWMGEEFEIGKDDELTIWYNIVADALIKKVTIVKNLQDYCIIKHPSALFFDYKHERQEDCYYLRLELDDGRFAWTSPIWIKQKTIKPN